MIGLELIFQPILIPKETCACNSHLSSNSVFKSNSKANVDSDILRSNVQSTRSTSSKVLFLKKDSKANKNRCCCCCEQTETDQQLFDSDCIETPPILGFDLPCITNCHCPTIWLQQPIDTAPPKTNSITVLGKIKSIGNLEFVVPLKIGNQIIANSFDTSHSNSFPLSQLYYLHFSRLNC